MKESSYNFFESTIGSAMIFYIKLKYLNGKNVKNEKFLAGATFAWFKSQYLTVNRLSFSCHLLVV